MAEPCEFGLVIRRRWSGREGRNAGSPAL